jgi:hypothetical protein
MDDDQRREFMLPTEEELAKVPFRRQIWHTLFDRGEMVEPILTRLPYRHQPGQNDSWAGAVVFAQAGQSFAGALGTYNVPSVSPRYWGVGDASCWIGIGGVGDSTTNLFQAGTDSVVVDIFGWPFVGAYAWVEWYPEDTIRWDNIPVNFGDEIFVELILTSTTLGQINMANLTQNVFGACSASAPEGNSLIANTVEWIVEDPGADQLIGTSLPNFGSVTFKGAIGVLNGVVTGSPFVGMVPANSGELLDMVNHEDVVEASAQFLGPTSVEITST